MYAYTTYPVLHASIPQEKTMIEYVISMLMWTTASLLCNNTTSKKPTYLLFKTFYLITLQTTPALPSLAPAFLFFSFSFFLSPRDSCQTRPFPLPPSPQKKFLPGEGGGGYMYFIIKVFISTLSQKDVRGWVVIDCQNLCPLFPPFSPRFNPPSPFPPPFSGSRVLLSIINNSKFQASTRHHAYFRQRFSKGGGGKKKKKNKEIKKKKKKK